MLTAIAAALLLQTFWTPNAATGTPVTGCTVDARVLVVVSDGVFPATIVGEVDADHCAISIDERPGLGPYKFGHAVLLSGANPPRPSAAALSYGAQDSYSDADTQRFRTLAMETHADARVYFSRFDLTSQDDLIVTRICNPDWTSPVCKRANGQFHGSYNQAMETLDRNNARAEAEARATRAASEPINSGYYTSGQYSRDVAAGQAGAAAASATPATGAPVAVQSENAIREAQARCRAGSGPC